MLICLFSISIFLGKECELSLVLNAKPKVLRILSQIIVVLLEIGLLWPGSKLPHDGCCPKLPWPLIEVWHPTIRLRVPKINRDIGGPILLFHSMSYHFAQFCLFSTALCTRKSKLQDLINNIWRLNFLVNTLNVVFTKIRKLGGNIL